MGLPLAARLRPGSDTANQLAVVDDAIAALAESWQAGHHDGDDAGEVVHEILVRSDIAGYSHEVIDGLDRRNLKFSIGMPANEAFDGHIHRLSHRDWRAARDGDGRPRKGAQVAELEAVPDWMPDGTRVIVRRERPHPGAQLKLWDHDGWRHQVIVTNQTGDARVLEARHRAHAQVENRIKRLKDIGEARFPFTRFTSNAAWLQMMLVAGLLLVATQVLLLDGDLAVAEPRRLRHTVLHAAARAARRSRQTWLRLADNWPWTPQLLAAYHRLAALQPAPG